MTAPLNQSTARLQRYSGALRFFGWATGILGMIGGIILAATTGHHDEVNPFDPSLVTTTATHPFIALGIASAISAIVSAVVLLAFAELLNWSVQKTRADHVPPARPMPQGPPTPQELTKP